MCDLLQGRRCGEEEIIYHLIWKCCCANEMWDICQFWTRHAFRGQVVDWLKEAANFIIKKRHLKLRDRDLRLYHAKADSTPSKKRNLPMPSADNSNGKRLAVAPRENHSDKNKTKNKPVLSYQGLKASKSIQKKETRKKEFSPANEAEVKQHKNKRPAVAARKAKALKGVGASRPTGLKRKPEGRTPDSFHRNKKARKLM
ncbi:hypothetical protein IFM89_005637 [Coptis chinensis]|uniref:Uncharacterized protein n=1 Tax=Coptis chinensis TaxID=261450 RepID=A0A835IUF9_9MAGN|nr:hypothetical protein IFM89_005637 [Coptis chinensis]